MSEENEFTWTVKADLPDERYGAASAVYEGRVWLMGGQRTSVVIYDPSNDTWTQGPELPQAIYSSPMADVSADGEIHLYAREVHLVLRHGVWTEAAGAPRQSARACRSIVLG